MAAARGLPRGVLIDLSGTVHVGSELVAGAAEALANLRQRGVPTLFVSNTTKTSSRRLHRQLTEELGLAGVTPSDIMTPLASARMIIEARGIHNPFLMVSDDAREEFDGMPPAFPGSSYDAVVVGLAPAFFSYDHLNTAFRAVRRGAPLIALHKGKYYATGTTGTDHDLALGPGAFVAALEFATGAEAEVVGKPSRGFFELAAAQLGVPVDSLWMVGDDVRSDIVDSVRAAGLAGGVLVRTGKYRAGDEAQLAALAQEGRACAVAEDLSDAVGKILELAAAAEQTGGA
uniref:Haloacid dehalogenase-like hydrolase domain-containing protein 2 n=1 Tax=Phaeomonas parva TaxID=124430 RepID=A0A7S1XZW0_9STRA|mmetsp:Transcript_5768/g.16174  ORF Transcript_5768/g.16174 Transcript_5768/m.16174 type:complete len:288 (+) Transcript_5768:1440-2303(+)